MLEAEILAGQEQDVAMRAQWLGIKEDKSSLSGSSINQLPFVPY